MTRRTGNAARGSALVAAAALATVAGCAAPQPPDPSPEPPPTRSADPDPTAGLEAPREGIFGPGSIWRTEVDEAPLNPDSDAMVAGLADQVEQHYDGTAALNLGDYANSFVVADEDTPRTDVAFDDCQDKGYEPGVLTKKDEGGHFLDVPVPDDAVPTPGSDGQLAVWDPDSDTLWELWRTSKDEDGWKACWGGRLDDVSTSEGWFEDGVGSSATGLPYSGGMVRLEEARAQEITHAMALNLVDLETWKTFSYPAQRSDGYNPDDEPNRIPEGLRLRLDPSVDVDALGLHPLAAAIARAAQTYGFIVTDKAGAVAVNAESGAGVEAETGKDPWKSILDGTPSYEVLEDFPWEDLQALPMDYGEE